MMNLAEKPGSHSHAIQSYGNAGFTIAGTLYPSSLLLTETLLQPLELEDESALSLAHFAPVLQLSPPLEVLLIGTGKTHRPLALELKTALRAAAIAHDTMDTGAACRTFNVLLGEARRVGAVLVKL
jgi:uncharacterized protein